MTRKPFSKHSIVTTPEGGALFSIGVRGHELYTDQPERGGGTDAAPTPLELLGAALSGCVALYVHRYCEKEGLVADDLVVEVKPFWRDDPGRVGRYDVIVHIPDTIPAAHHAAIDRVARSCPVHATLTHAPEIVVRLESESLVAA